MRSIFRITISALCILWAVSCRDSAKDDEISQMLIRFTPVLVEQTRSSYISGSDINENESIGVSASLCPGGVWDSESASIDYFFNKRLIRWENDYSYLENEFWPPMPLRFFSYYPYNAKGIKLSAPTSIGFPTIDFTVEDDVRNQYDLIVGMTGVMTPTPYVNLRMNHALVRVGFSIRAIGFTSDIGVESITVTNIIGRATQSYDNNNNIVWTLRNDIRRNYTVSVENGSLKPEAIITNDFTPLTTEQGYLMMIPQPFQAGASFIVVNYTVDGESHQYTTAIPQSQPEDVGGWGAAKVINYKVTITP